MVARPGALQATFNSGEVASELYSRSDVKQFYASAATMENVEPVPQGGFRLLDRSRDLGPQRPGHLGQPGDVAAAGQGDGAVGVGAARPHAPHGAPPAPPPARRCSSCRPGAT